MPFSKSANDASLASVLNEVPTEYFIWSYTSLPLNISLTLPSLCVFLNFLTMSWTFCDWPGRPTSQSK